MPATMRDIARRLNISVSTVSYALNGGPRPVTAELKERVMEVAKELKFTPNRLARNLSVGTTQTIGYVAWKPHRDSLLGPHSHQILNGVLNACDDTGYDFLIFAHHGQDSRSKFISQLTDRRVDGIVITGDDELAEVRKALHEASVPTVVIGGNGEDAEPTLRIDNFGGVAKAIRHLHDLGHRDIGYLGGIKGIADSDEREKGFQLAMQSCGLAIRQEWMADASFLISRAEALAARMLQQRVRPSALMCANDETAIGAIRGAHAIGMQVPRDVSIVGFDDIPFAWLTFPSLTTVRKPTTEIGYHGAKMLIGRMSGGEEPAPRIFDTDLVIRKSTRAVPARVESRLP